MANSARKISARKAKGSKKAHNLQQLIVLIGVPFGIFLTIQLLFLLAYNAIPSVVWLIIAAFAGAAILTLVKPQFTDKFAVLRPLGFLVLLTGGLSTVIGATNYASSAQEYFGFDSRQVYTNVLPSEPAAAHYDAGLLIFSQNAGVDHTKAVRQN